jgi:putative ABC transport system permease protein
MKTIIRNFLSVLRRYRLATVLNVLGLSVAFATFMVIMMQVDYDRNFDRCHPEADRIFRLEISLLDMGWVATNNHLMADAFAASSPHILAMSMEDMAKVMLADGALFSVERDGVRHTYHEKWRYVTPSFTDVFTLRMVEGRDAALSEPGRVLMPQSLARKYFGEEPALGRQLVMKDSVYSVGGVYADFPRNSTVENHIYTSMPLPVPSENDGNFNFLTYVRTDGHVRGETLTADFMKTFDITALFGKEAALEVEFRLTPLSEIHYTTDARFDRSPKTSRQTVRILSAIALVILLIAGINYTNFSAALMPKRIKSINTQKVFGGSNGMIRFALVVEAVAVALAAYLLALGWVALAKDTPAAALVAADMALAAHGGLAAAAAGLAVLTGCLAGLYPAFRITSYAPALVLKGSFGLSPGGRRMRNLLVGIQFFAAFALLIAASFIHLQNRYMVSSSPGYDREAVIVTDLSDRVREQRDAFADRLKNVAGIEELAFSQSLFGGTDDHEHWGAGYHDRQVLFSAFLVSPSFLDVMHIRPTEGRGFRPEDRDGVWVFNRKAREELGLVLNDQIRNGEMVGFIPDIRANSFRLAVKPMGFFVPPAAWNTTWHYAYVKVAAGSDLRTALTHVRQTIREFDADYPFDVRFFDEVLNRLYEKEQQTGLLITLFSLVAIFIAMVGVFGLVVFDSEYRRKEIGIRKVFGASTREILFAFNKSYVRILCVCFLLAAPVAWYVVSRWLESFAYKTPMYWWVYAAAFAAVFLLTVATVSFQNRRAANMNPIESIKSD